MNSTESDSPAAPGLARSLGFGQVTASGVGIIIGAGIYVLLGAATAEAGAGVWIAFLVAGALSALTALSYAELSSMYPNAGAEYDYTRRVAPAWVAFTIGWLMILGLVIAAAAVSLGFASYLRYFVDVPQRLGAWMLLGLVAAIALAGIEQSARLTVMLSTVQVAGLLVIVAIGIPHLGDENLITGASTAGVMTAAALVFFAFVGFDEVITLAEETTDPSRTGALPPIFGRISGRRAPWFAVLLSVTVAAAFVGVGDLSLVASVTDFAVYIVFIAVNVTVILLRFWQPKRRRPFAITGTLGKVPIAPVLALATIAVLVPSLDPAAILLGLAVTASGVALYFAQRRLRPAPTRIAPTPGGSMMPRMNITRAEAADVADTLRVDFAAVDFDLDQFQQGMRVELQHGTGDPDTNITDDDLVTTGKIALAHLNEIPDYYTRLAAMEAAAHNHDTTS